ncbi:hypothetical protein CDAR_416571 [Caerostris darwini]|uniref:Uncharacterized protein n=1 Tax=Caerostris darwini TaxID=1538125 RepID=A0AAV4MKK7_9ARAC|nr:hypothetical protein CDAR_416571 [Caerostris darwini]
MILSRFGFLNDPFITQKTKIPLFYLVTHFISSDIPKVLRATTKQCTGIQALNLGQIKSEVRKEGVGGSRRGGSAPQITCRGALLPFVQGHEDCWRSLTPF